MPSSHRHSIQEEISGVVAFIMALWVVFAASWFLPWLKQYGLEPRTLGGLVGVATMPLLHADLGHLVGNTIPLFVLLTLLAGSRGSTPAIVASIVVVGGGLLWIFGRNGTEAAPIEHIGASGLVFGLATFLIAAGPLEKRLVPMAVAVLVGFLYGFTLLRGVLPIQPGVSWDGHLCGGIAGVAVAFLFARDSSSRRGDEDVAE